MQPIFIPRLASYAMMPLVAAGGFAGYSYYNQPYAYPQSSCVALTQNVVTTTYQPQVVNLQRFFVDRGYLRGNPNGYFDQPTVVALERFQADSGIPISGRIDSQTVTIIQQITCGNGYGGYPSPYPYDGGGYAYGGQLSLQGIDAPSSLAAGQSGSFTVRVRGYTYGGGTLHYSVVWGDENYYGRGASAQYGASSVQSSGTFTHTYYYPGTYRPTFTVTDSYGHQAQASVTVRVTGSAYPTYCNYGHCAGTNQYSYPNSYPNSYGYSNGYPYGCTGYYDRACYSNGQYIGPDFNGSGYTYNGPGDNYAYANPYGGPNGPDYSCYYDRACLAQMNGYGY